MSNLLASAVCLLVTAQGSAERATFDFVSYVPPKGWTESKTDQVRSYSVGKEDGDYGQIVVYKSLVAFPDAKKNFDVAWEALVTKQLGVSKDVTSTGPTTIGTIQAVSGSGTVEIAKSKYSVLLTTYTRKGEMQNVLILVNSQKYVNAVGAFAESIKLADSPGVKEAPATSTTGYVGMNTKRVSNYRVPTLYMRVYTDTAVYRTYGWYAVYPNGDALKILPDVGFYGIDKPLLPESWGRWTKSGNSVTVSSERWGRQELDILSDQKWRVKGSTLLTFYRVQPVNGLRIEGYYSAEKLGWKRGKVDYLGNQTYIAFQKDGSFNDYGCYYKSRLTAPMSGKYEIKDFSLILTYSDGVEVQRSFAGVGSEDPTKTKSVYVIGGIAWYLEAK